MCSSQFATGECIRWTGEIWEWVASENNNRFETLSSSTQFFVSHRRLRQIRPKHNKYLMMCACVRRTEVDSFFTLPARRTNYCRNVKMVSVGDREQPLTLLQTRDGKMSLVDEHCEQKIDCVQNNNIVFYEWMCAHTIFDSRMFCECTQW